MAKTDRETDTPSDWAKHLKPFRKRQFYKRVRSAIKGMLSNTRKHGMD